MYQVCHPQRDEQGHESKTATWKQICCQATGYRRPDNSPVFEMLYLIMAFMEKTKIFSRASLY
jgi:hypothetical protein